MASQYLIKHLEDPKVRYYITTGYRIYCDFCNIYAMEAEDFLSFLSYLGSTEEDVNNFYARLAKWGINPFKK